MPAPVAKKIIPVDVAAQKMAPAEWVTKHTNHCC